MDAKGKRHVERKVLTLSCFCGLFYRMCFFLVKQILRCWLGGAKAVKLSVFLKKRGVDVKQKLAERLSSIHFVYGTTMVMFVLAAVIMEPFPQLVENYIAILRSPDILVTDYIYVGGLYAALLNAGITSLLSLGMLVAFKHDPRSQTISNLWLVTGFAFFGKNIFTVIPIYFGGWLYSKYMKQDFNVNILTMLVAAALSPAVTQKIFISVESTFIDVGFAIGMGIIIGFIFDPVAKNLFKAHDGFNLYNAGFTAGMIAIIITAIFDSFGIAYEMNNQWSSGYNLEITIIILAVSVWNIFVGLYTNRHDIRATLGTLIEKRKLQNDYYSHYGTKCYVNMGVIAIYCVIVAHILRLELNGLILGAILSIIGFGANGKQLYSATALMTGIVLSTLLSPMTFENPNVGVALFFVTCLSPIPAKFGWHWGVLAGALHLHIVTSLAMPSGGINLYNNGISAGFVAILLLPLIRSVNDRMERKKQSK